MHRTSFELRGRGKRGAILVSVDDRGGWAIVSPELAPFFCQLLMQVCGPKDTYEHNDETKIGSKDLNNDTNCRVGVQCIGIHIAAASERLSFGASEIVAGDIIAHTAGCVTLKFVSTGARIRRTTIRPHAERTHITPIEKEVIDVPGADYQHARWLYENEHRRDEK